MLHRPTRRSGYSATWAATQSFSAVDSSTVLPGGVGIEGSTDLVSYLLGQREEEFTGSLTWHMMTYALARAPNLGDEAELTAIHRHFRTSGYKLSALVLAIVQSEVFQAAPDVPTAGATDTPQQTDRLNRESNREKP